MTKMLTVASLIHPTKLIRTCTNQKDVKSRKTHPCGHPETLNLNKRGILSRELKLSDQSFKLLLDLSVQFM